VPAVREAMGKIDKHGIVGILVSDIHLSLNPPIWRSAEPDWKATMAGYLKELGDLSKKYSCPIICAGDVFDYWKSSPELINFAMDHLPEMYAIPGQHDLPLHNYEDMEKSAFATLIKAGIIHLINPNEPTVLNGIALFGFPWGKPLVPLAKDKQHPDRLNIAVIHEYKWIQGKSYPNAPKNAEITGRESYYNGWDTIHYGDNHIGFHGIVNRFTVYNPGSFMRRKSDQIDYKPRVGLLHISGGIKSHYLDISKDLHLTGNPDNKVKEDLNIQGFFDELEKLGHTALDYRDALERYMDKTKVKKPIRQIILMAMEMANGTR